MARKIKVSVARLAKPLEVREIEAGTKLGEFLKELGVEYNSSVRVNAEAAKAGSVLKKGDIISIIGAISGGLL